MNTRTEFIFEGQHYVMISLPENHDKHEVYRVESGGLEMFEGYAGDCETSHMWHAPQVRDHIVAHNTRYHPDALRA